MLLFSSLLILHSKFDTKTVALGNFLTPVDLKPITT